ncbi:hypothetical protein [Bradyrhizobium sp. CER78]|uniref:hypothetical protein n=1 Tax=Bradyrhizobium sp. CER78 TaxID=3039162 RepID=UPI00244A8395|nr:hypothetical protein [Bradyrhizobium sp. CER78]MDH2380836.1 hypothetical protein [Bradyrhizobium sp. CER78]
MDGDDWVDILLRLPTRCCSRGVARPEADDLDQAVSSFPWVREERPQLWDQKDIGNVSGGELTGEAPEAVAAGSFLGQLRRIAFERCQEVMILALRGVGYEDPVICRMSLGDFDEVEFGSADVERQRSCYRTCLVERQLASVASDRALVTYEGSPVGPHQLVSYLRRLRAARISMQLNRAIRPQLFAVIDGELERGRNEATLGLSGKATRVAAPCDPLRSIREGGEAEQPSRGRPLIE